MTEKSLQPAAKSESSVVQTEATTKRGEVSLGTIGAVISVVGTVLTCGILAPLGLMISLLALKHRPFKHAIIGVVTGGLGTLVLGALSFAVYATYLLDDDTDGKLRRLMEQTPLHRAGSRIEVWRESNDHLPSFQDGQTLIANLHDRWGQSILYVPLPKGYLILSLGPDGQFETADDVMLLSLDAAVD
ncbi:MAG: hypothetical protein MPJ50_14005 [Pirellulales bacterium]|nr:hypothetical protein [Pirellulales bacterium]